MSRNMHEMTPWLGWQPRRAIIAELALYAATAAILTQRYSREVNAFDSEGIRLGTQADIVAGEAPDPYRFRLLVPMATQLLWRSSPMREDPAWLDRITFLLVGVLLILTFYLLRVMMTELGWSAPQSLVAPLMLAVALPMAFLGHDYQPWSWIELASIPFVIILLLRRAPVWSLIAVAVIASLNRETAIALALIPLALLLMAWRAGMSRGYYLRAVLALTIPWVALRIGMIALWPGGAETRVISVEEIWSRNTDFTSAGSLQWGGWFTTITVVAGFMGAVVVAALVGISTQRCPAEALWIVGVAGPVFVGGWLVFAIWGEVRVLLPVFVLLLPLAMAAFANPQPRDRESASAPASLDGH